MKLFDRISEDDEEVVIREQEEKEEENETRLKQEVEEKVSSQGAGSTVSGRDESSGSSESFDLPGMSDSSSTSSSSSSRSSRSRSVDLEDVHEQNKEIISLLRDIKNEVDGGSNELL